MDEATCGFKQSDASSFHVNQQRQLSFNSRVFPQINAYPIEPSVAVDSHKESWDFGSYRDSTIVGMSYCVYFALYSIVLNFGLWIAWLWRAGCLLSVFVLSTWAQFSAKEIIMTKNKE